MQGARPRPDVVALETTARGAEPGAYEVTTTVISSGESATETTRFEVRR